MSTRAKTNKTEINALANIAAPRFVFSFLSPALVKSIVVMALSLLFATPSSVRAQEPTQQYVTLNFRPGHSVSLLAAVQRNRWTVRKAGSVENVSGQSFTPGYFLRYAFHFNLLNNTGMLLGTAAGAYFEAARHKGFVPGPSIWFPSITGGLVQSLSFENRISICAEYSAAWYHQLKTVGVDGQPASAPVIPDVGAFFMQYDYFYSRTRSFTAILGFSQAKKTCTDDACQPETLMGSMNVKNEGVFFQVGVTWQPGDELNSY